MTPLKTADQAAIRPSSARSLPPAHVLGGQRRLWVRAEGPVTLRW